MARKEHKSPSAGVSSNREPHWITMVVAMLAAIGGAVLISAVGSGRLL